MAIDRRQAREGATPNFVSDRDRSERVGSPDLGVAPSLACPDIAVLHPCGSSSQAFGRRQWAAQNAARKRRRASSSVAWLAGDRGDDPGDMRAGSIARVIAHASLRDALRTGPSTGTERHSGAHVKGSEAAALSGASIVIRRRDPVDFASQSAQPVPEYRSRSGRKSSKPGW
jgi:hypothetical protein